MIPGNGLKRSTVTWDIIFGKNHVDIDPNMPIACKHYTIVFYRNADLNDLYRIGKAVLQSKTTEKELTVIKLLITGLEECRKNEVRSIDSLDACIDS